MPAYGQAKADGLIPHVPPTPPVVSVRPTAQRALRDVALVGAVFSAGVLLVFFIGGASGRLPASALLALLIVSALGFTGLWFTIRRWGRTQIAELQLGYTTTTFTLGRFWIGSAPDGPVTNGWVEWNWDSTWWLRPDGEVVEPPSGDVEPPGLYPSPRREGALELWTGCQWSGYLPEKTG